MATRFELVAPAEMAGGVYANFLTVWHTAHEFTLDFSATLPEHRQEDDVVVPCQLTARVKVPVSVLFDMLRAINDNMTRYEEVFGPISGPRPAS
jgi:hypothetical protein